jgi:hypothetical protein
MTTPAVSRRQLAPRRRTWRLTPALSLALALLLIGITVVFSVEALAALGPAAWVWRLAGISTLAAAYLLLAWGVTTRTGPVPVADKVVSMFSATLGLLTAVGAAALALAVH